MVKAEENIYIINLVFKIFYFITACLLGYICIFMNRLITKHKLENLENYNNLFEPYLLNVDNSDLGSLSSDGNNENINNANDKKDINSNNENQKENKQKEGVFYNIKKKAK